MARPPLLPACPQVRPLQDDSAHPAAVGRGAGGQDSDRQVQLQQAQQGPGHLGEAALSWRLPGRGGAERPGLRFPEHAGAGAQCVALPCASPARAAPPRPLTRPAHRFCPPCLCSCRLLCPAAGHQGGAHLPAVQGQPAGGDDDGRQGGAAAGAHRAAHVSAPASQAASQQGQATGAVSPQPRLTSLSHGGWRWWSSRGSWQCCISWEHQAAAVRSASCERCRRLAAPPNGLPAAEAPCGRRRRRRSSSSSAVWLRFLPLLVDFSQATQPASHAQSLRPLP